MNNYDKSQPVNNYEKIKELSLEAMTEILVLTEANVYKELNIELSDEKIEDIYNKTMEMLLRVYPPYLGVVG